MRKFSLAIGIIAGNWVWQALFESSPNWWTAFERSYFQAFFFVALIFSGAFRPENN